MWWFISLIAIALGAISPVLLAFAIGFFETDPHPTSISVLHWLLVYTLPVGAFAFVVWCILFVISCMDNYP